MSGIRSEASPAWLAGDHALLCAAVREGGAIAADRFGRHARQWRKERGDLVTEVDLAIDRALRHRLLGERLGYGWLSEESRDDPARLDAERVWIVDPIDGTRSYIAGRPEFVVSAALTVAGRPVAGAVYNPIRNEFVEAVAGGGTRWNGACCRVSTASAIAGARLLSSDAEMRGIGWQDRFPEAEVSGINAIAYKLALVAAGRFDGVIALWAKSDWDLAAGDLLVSEAGGVVTGADGAGLVYNRPYLRHPTLVAAGAALARRLRARLL